MTYFTDEHERLHLERRMTRDVEERFTRLQQQIDALNALQLESATYYTPPNYLPNSHPEWSKAAYTTGSVTPTTAGDDNRECYQWFRQPSNATVLNAAIGRVQLTGGGSGSVNQITVNAVNIMSGAESYDTSLAVTAANVAANINAHNSSPEYTAIAEGTNIFIFSAAAAYPVEPAAGAGAYVVASNTTTITATDFDMSLSALKRSHATPHSQYAANEGADDNIPIWDGVNGNIQLGGNSVNWDIAAPINVDIIYPGQNYFVTLEVQTTGSKSTSMQLYCGFWDNAAGDWIRGGTFTPTLSVYGTAGSRTLNYKVYAETDSGEQLLSAEVTTTTAPATLSAENHVRISFSGAPGFTRYDIYRKDGSNYYRVGSIRNSIDLEFYDTVESGSTVVPVSGYPSVTATAPAAYAISNEFDPNDSSAFTIHKFQIRVPTTYDRSGVVAGDQWFRFGISELTSPRSIVVRRIGVSEGYGGWTRSPRDLTAASAPTSTSTSAPTTSYPTGNPPERGTGGRGDCVTLDTEIETLNHLYEPIIRPIRQIERGMYLSCGPVSLPVISTREGEVASILHIKSKKGLEIKCSHSHRFIRSNMDKTGTAAGSLEVGDKVLVCIDGKFVQDVVESVVEVVGPHTVKSVRLPSPHLFLTNGFVSHNAKSELPPIL